MSSAEEAHRYRIGDRVRVKRANPTGNPRTPTFVWGKTGVVSALHGAIVNPLDHRGVYQPLCTVVFRVADVFGSGGNDTLAVDVHEDWLDPG